MIYDEEIPVAQSRYIDIGETTLRYLSAGDSGPPVVCIHGSGIDDAALSWRHVIPALSDDFRVFAPDLPGYGQSDAPAKTPTVPYYRSVFETFLTELGLDGPANDDVILVGISMGGAVALGTALNNPALWRRLILVNSYGLTDRIPGGVGTSLLASVPFVDSVGRQVAADIPGAARATVAGLVHDPNDLSPAFLDAVDRRVSEPNAGRSFVQFMRAEFGLSGVETSYEERLGTLDGPVHLLHGRSDPLIPVSWGQKAAAAIPDATLTLFDRCGHWPPRERPERFTAVLSELLCESR